MAYYGAPNVDDDCQPHFLEACFLCSKPLGDNSEIFMYRGNTPFCSKDCREEQIEFDEAKERKNRNANNSSSNNNNNKSSSSETKDSSTANSIWTASLAVAY